LQLAGYHFFKVIEIVVRNEESMSRDVVKNLSQLEELAWRKGESHLDHPDGEGGAHSKLRRRFPSFPNGEKCQ
jgi:hypothetical protein